MPSAAHSEAVILATPKGAEWGRRTVKLLACLILLATIAVGSLFIALEQGYFDRTLTARAEAALSNALGDDFRSEVGAVRLRFNQGWMLALAAVDVHVTHVPSGITALSTDSIAVVVDPISLVKGRLALASAEIRSAEGDLRFLPAGAPIDLATIRVDRVPDDLAAFYPALDDILHALERTDVDVIRISSIGLLLPEKGKFGDRVELRDVSLKRRRHEAGYDLAADVAHGALSTRLALSVETKEGQAQAASLAVTGLESRHLLLRTSDATGERRHGIDLPLDIRLSSVRGASLQLDIAAGSGSFYADGEAQPVKSGHARLSYDFAERKLELTEGLIDLGETVIPLEGAVMDHDRLNPGNPHGFAFTVVGNEAIANVPNSGELPESFNISATGYFLPAEKVLRIDNLGVATASGILAGSLNVRFEEPSPSVTFAARSEHLSVASVKQLWPFWFGKKARRWILEHITGGSVHDAEIEVSLASGRIPDHPEPLKLRAGELRIAFGAEGLAVKFHNDMPRSEQTSGRFLMDGEKLTIAIDKGEIPLPSGKVVAGSAGTFSIEDVSAKPLMASLAISAAGDASAIAEFAAYEPIDAMSRAPFKAADLSGAVKADIKAKFGLERDQDPPAPTWQVNLDLSKVDLKQPLQGRSISNLDGSLKIDTKNAVLDGKAEIDGIELAVDLVEPLAEDKRGRKLELGGTLSDSDVAKMSPMLAGIMKGKVGVNIDAAGSGSQQLKLDLTSASVSVPIVGWKKGPGIPARARFALATKDGVTDIRDFVLEGDGFGARGDLTLDQRGLVSAKLSHVRFSNADNFALAISRKSGGYDINVSGESIDMRPFIERMKSTQSTLADAEAKLSNSISAKLDSATGYNKESLSSVALKLVSSKGTISLVDFSAVTRSGQAVVISRSSAEGAIVITSGDAGAAARFTDIYRNMNGGLLNITLRARNKDSWRGSVDIRNFALVNEARLKSIVSARSGRDGKSLSDALKADIDVSSQKFRRGFARLMIDGKIVRVENGVMRGDQVGATFQGIVRDGNGKMDMTGTFMPAYGINRLFGELPLIGEILGNGRDRGLVGITFKLVGPFDQPKLSVNPLSLIAPGVFRNIFEFE